MSKETRAKIVIGMKSTFSPADDIVRNTSSGGYYKFLRLKFDNDEYQALFRVTSQNGGLNYHELALIRDGNGVVRVRDMYPYSGGEWISQSTRRLLQAAPLTEGNGFLERLLAPKNEVASSVEAVGKLRNLMSLEKYQEALDLSDTLPSVIQRDKMFMIIRATAASRVNQEEYEKALQKFSSAFPADPALTLMSYDYYFVKKNFEKCLELLKSLEESVGTDAYVNFLRANLYLQMNELAQALTQAHAAIQIEPKLISPYWIMVTVSLKNKEFKETARLLTTIEAEFGLEISDLHQIPAYAEFTQSVEYQNWARSRH